jgi:hypothetical protein
MFTHPYLGSQLARERQRDMLAQADQQRLVRQFRDLARASRRAEPAGRRMTRVFKRTRPAALPS